jgi:peptidoglycan hydrolase-like protein with peptidoglycan-binding domain
VQTKLASQGYYRGQVDSVIGSGSIAAIRRYQAEHGLPATGKIDPKLLKSLGIAYKAQAQVQWISVWQPKSPGLKSRERERTLPGSPQFQRCADRRDGHVPRTMEQA